MADTETRVQSHPTGIAGAALGTVERQVSSDEAPALGLNRDLAVIGKPVRRLNGRAKVTGTARFTVDVKLPGMLYARLLRSPHPHARIDTIDASAAEHHPNVRAVYLITSAVGRAVESPPADQRPQRRPQHRPPAASCTSAIRWSESPRRRPRMRALPSVSSGSTIGRCPLSSTSTMRGPTTRHGSSRARSTVRAMPAERRGRPELPQRGNVRGPNAAGSRGDAEQGFAQADVIVEGEFRTQVQTHCCLETHAVVADWRADGLTVYMSTQYAAGVRNELAAAFDLPRSRVRVVVRGDGRRFRLQVQRRQLRRARPSPCRGIARAPVRLVLDRDEEQQDSGNRPATMQRFRVGAARDGRLTAISLDEYGTAGVGTGRRRRATSPIAMYECPNVAIAQHDVFINAGPGCRNARARQRARRLRSRADRSTS